MDIFPIQFTLKLTIHLKSIYQKNKGLAYFCKTLCKNLGNVEIVLIKNGNFLVLEMQIASMFTHSIISRHKKASENHIFWKPSPSDSSLINKVDSYSIIPVHDIIHYMFQKSRVTLTMLQCFNCGTIMIPHPFFRLFYS